MHLCSLKCHLVFFLCGYVCRPKEWKSKLLMSSCQTTNFSLCHDWSIRSSLMSSVPSSSSIDAGSKRTKQFLFLASVHRGCWFAQSHCYVSPPFRYCVLLITGDEETFSFGKQAFLSFASTNAKEVVRFAYVYQRLQQPLCDILLQNRDSAQSPTQVRWYMSAPQQLGPLWICKYKKESERQCHFRISMYIIISKYFYE